MLTSNRSVSLGLSDFLKSIECTERVFFLINSFLVPVNTQLDVEAVE